MSEYQRHATGDPSTTAERLKAMQLDPDEVRLHLVPFLTGYCPEAVNAALDQILKVRDLVANDAA